MKIIRPASGLPDHPLHQEQISQHPLADSFNLLHFTVQLHPFGGLRSIPLTFTTFAIVPDRKLTALA